MTVAAACRIGRDGDTLLPMRRGRCCVAWRSGFREGDTVLLEGTVLRPGSGIQGLGRLADSAWAVGQPASWKSRRLDSQKRRSWARWGHCSSDEKEGDSVVQLGLRHEKGTVLCSVALREGDTVLLEGAVLRPGSGNRGLGRLADSAWAVGQPESWTSRRLDSQKRRSRLETDLIGLGQESQGFAAGQAVAVAVAWLLGREGDTALLPIQAVAVAAVWRLGRDGDTVLPTRKKGTVLCSSVFGMRRGRCCVAWR